MERVARVGRAKSKKKKEIDGKRSDKEQGCWRRREGEELDGESQRREEKLHEGKRVEIAV
jgi:hypothetical protein